MVKDILNNLILKPRAVYVSFVFNRMLSLGVAVRTLDYIPVVLYTNHEKQIFPEITAHGGLGLLKILNQRHVS